MIPGFGRSEVVRIYPDIEFFTSGNDKKENFMFLHKCTLYTHIETVHSILRLEKIR